MFIHIYLLYKEIVSIINFIGEKMKQNTCRQKVKFTIFLEVGESKIYLHLFSAKKMHHFDTVPYFPPVIVSF